MMIENMYFANLTLCLIYYILFILDCKRLYLLERSGKSMFFSY